MGFLIWRPFAGKSTLFCPIADTEALQAMSESHWHIQNVDQPWLILTGLSKVILASWGDTGWRPGSHAVSMAWVGFNFFYLSPSPSHSVLGFNRIDMELYKCLPRLSERLQTPSAFTNDRDEDTERRLVIGSRLWLLVCKMAIEWVDLFQK